jgi:hypothetical protein
VVIHICPMQVPHPRPGLLCVGICNEQNQDAPLFYTLRAICKQTKGTLSRVFYKTFTLMSFLAQLSCGLTGLNGQSVGRLWNDPRWRRLPSDFDPTLARLDAPLFGTLAELIVHNLRLLDERRI